MPRLRPSATNDTVQINDSALEMNCSGLNENIGSQASERDSWEDTSDPHLIIANAVEDIFDQYAVDEQSYSLRTAPESPVPIQGPQPTAVSLAFSDLF